MCLVSTSTFPCHRSTPQRARGFCLRFLREVLPGNSAARDVIDGCLLVVSELGTNAVQAGSTMVAISVEVHRDHIWLAADDDGPGLPRPVAARASDGRGRGLAIVDSVSRAWGCCPSRTVSGSGPMWRSRPRSWSPLIAGSSAWDHRNRLTTVDEDLSHGYGGLMSRPPRGPEAGEVMAPAVGPNGSW